MDDTEEDYTAEQIENGRLLFAGSCDFIAGVPDLSIMIPEGHTEIAFAGRSNVGKSSLINALTGRKALARTSHTPGRTQQLNFFEINKRFNLVDMPGYGYAKVSKTQKAEWKVLIRAYLRGRASLRACFVLIDSRHGIKDVDNDIMELLDEAAVMYRVILTKTDKAKKSELPAVIEKTEAALRKRSAAYPTVFLTSAHEKDNINELRVIVDQLTL
jgi:GTP-binding protein